MARRLINGMAFAVILLGAASAMAGNVVSARMPAECVSGDGKARCSCGGACYADGGSCGCL